MTGLLPLISFLPWFFSAPDAPMGATLFPERVADAEPLRFVVDGVVFEEPDFTADTLDVHAAGDTILARGERSREGIRWVELADSGWAPAARLDRQPATLEDDPEPGREGMAAGRVLPWSWRPGDLVAMPDSLKVPGFEGKTLRLRRDAAQQFAALVTAARVAGVGLAAFSAFRDADYQRRLYVRAVEADPAQHASAAPGRSEHQLGTTVDVATPGTVLADASLEDTPAGRWLTAHAAQFGFVVSFSRDRHEARGVAFEPWHLRWVGRHVEDESGW